MNLNLSNGNSAAAPLLWPPPHSALDDTQPVAQLSLWHHLFFRANLYTLLVALSVAGAVWQITFAIVLAAWHISNVGHYTYWSLWMFTLFSLALALALFVRRGSLTVVTLW